MKIDYSGLIKSENRLRKVQKRKKLKQFTMKSPQKEIKLEESTIESVPNLEETDPITLGEDDATKKDDSSSTTKSSAV